MITIGNSFLKMSKGSPPETYIPEAAAPVITRSVTPQRDYQYAADYLDKLETERKELEQKTWNELSDVYRQETAKEDQYYRDSLAKDEPDYTAGLDPYQLNIIASQVYGGGAAAALQDLRNRRFREYVPVAGANPMGGPPASAAPAAPIPISLPKIPANLFTPSPAPAPRVAPRPVPAPAPRPAPRPAPAPAPAAAPAPKTQKVTLFGRSVAEAKRKTPSSIYSMESIWPYTDKQIEQAAIAVDTPNIKTDTDLYKVADYLDTKKYGKPKPRDYDKEELLDSIQMG